MYIKRSLTHLIGAAVLSLAMDRPNWDPALGKLQDRLAPPATEAENRYMAPLKDSLGKASLKPALIGAG
jgi:hypothetical protein